MRTKYVFWCLCCDQAVDPVEVAPDETHDISFGGCGYPVELREIELDLDDPEVTNTEEV